MPAIIDTQLNPAVYSGSLFLYGEGNKQKEETKITRREMVRLEDSFSFQEQEDGRIEVRVCMKRDQIAILRELMFESDFSDRNNMQNLIYEFGSTLTAADYVGRRCFLCLISLIRGNAAWMQQA